MDAGGSQNMRLDQLVERHQRVSSGTDLVGKGRETERHAFAGEPLSLTVERLVLPILLEQEHGEEAGPRPTARDHMERGGCLRDLLAVPAGELLPKRRRRDCRGQSPKPSLDHLPGAGDDLERLGDVLAELGQPVPAAGRAGTVCRHYDTLARQMIGERLPCGALALEGGDRGGLGCRFLSDQIVFGSVGLELFELQLHLIEQAAAAFGAGAVLLALQLGYLQLEVSDQRLDGALVGHGVGELGRGSSGVLLSLLGSAGHGRHQRLERIDIVRKRRDGGFHEGE